MPTSATTLGSRLLLVLALFIVPGLAQAQDVEELGDEFIFFVNGTNVLLPEFQGTVSTDPVDPTSGNQVARFSYGNFTAAGFRFDRVDGVDMTDNVSDVPGEGDTLYFKLNVDPENAGKPNLSITMFDKTDDDPANDGTADLEFRLQWAIPDSMRNGEWWDLAIPLPPTTSAALDSAKVGLTPEGEPLETPLDPLAANWTYGGAWSSGAFGVWSSEEDLWQEFQWDGVNGLTVFFDTDQGGAPVFLDDVYIGGPATDLSAAVDPPAAMSGVTFEPAGAENVISWTPNDDFGAYFVYASENEITDLDAEGVLQIGTVPFDAESFEVRHEPTAPHPTLANEKMLHYAVTSASLFGVENTDVSNSSGSVTNTLESQPFVLELTSDESDMIFDNLANGVASREGFPEGMVPFVLNSETIATGDLTEMPASDADFSATVWMGYNQFNELYIYGEVLDDHVVFAGEAVPGGEAWQFDNFEVGYGAYEVPFLVGSAHEDMLRGEEPDFQFRTAPRADADGNIGNNITFIGWSLDADHEAGGTAADYITDDAGNVVGYRFLSLYALDQIQNAEEEDAVLDPPATDEIKLVPMQLVFGDNDVLEDGSTAREHQVGLDFNPAFGANWWNTPAQWPIVAFAGRAISPLSGTSNESDGEVPAAFALDQNYPNPFNPSTTVRFELASAQQVTLSVYDVLGRKVATLINGQRLTSGAHEVAFDGRDLASGFYVYRLEAGTAFTQTRTMLLLK